jgi:cobalt/nickel transport system ATP-binding protein
MDCGTPLYICRDVSYTYPDGSAALDNVSLEICRGTSTAIIGVNGSGKSTLLLILSGLLNPSKGSILYKGVPLDKYRGLRREVGIVFQNPEDQFITSTVYEEIIFGPRQLGLEDDELESIVEEVSNQFMVKDLLGKSPFRLSGGEKRRVAIASIASYDPEIFILDEPFQDLSLNYKIMLIKYLVNKAREGHTIIYSCNDTDIPIFFVDYIGILYRGKLIAYGEAGDIIRDMDLLRSAELDTSILKTFYRLLDNEDVNIPFSIDILDKILDL